MFKYTVINVTVFLSIIIMFMVASPLLVIKWSNKNDINRKTNYSYFR
jgi:hypothetical protein